MDTVPALHVDDLIERYVDGKGSKKIGFAMLDCGSCELDALQTGQSLAFEVIAEDLAKMQAKYNEERKDKPNSEQSSPDQTAAMNSGANTTKKKQKSIGLGVDKLVIGIGPDMLPVVNQLHEWFYAPYRDINQMEEKGLHKWTYDPVKSVRQLSDWYEKQIEIDNQNEQDALKAQMMEEFLQRPALVMSHSLRMMQGSDQGNHLSYPQRSMTDSRLTFWAPQRLTYQDMRRIYMERNHLLAHTVDVTVITIDNSKSNRFTIAINDPNKDRMESYRINQVGLHRRIYMRQVDAVLHECQMHNPPVYVHVGARLGVEALAFAAMGCRVVAIESDWASYEKMKISREINGFTEAKMQIIYARIGKKCSSGKDNPPPSEKTSAPYRCLDEIITEPVRLLNIAIESKLTKQFLIPPSSGKDQKSPNSPLNYLNLVNMVSINFDPSIIESEKTEIVQHLCESNFIALDYNSVKPVIADVNHSTSQEKICSKSLEAMLRLMRYKKEADIFFGNLKSTTSHYYLDQLIKSRGKDAIKELQVHFFHSDYAASPSSQKIPPVTMRLLLPKGVSSLPAVDPLMGSFLHDTCFLDKQIKSASKQQQPQRRRTFIQIGVRDGEIAINALTAAAYGCDSVVIVDKLATYQLLKDIELINDWAGNRRLRIFHGYLGNNNFKRLPSPDNNNLAALNLRDLIHHKVNEIIALQLLDPAEMNVQVTSNVNINPAVLILTQFSGHGAEYNPPRHVILPMTPQDAPVAGMQLLSLHYFPIRYSYAATESAGSESPSSGELITNIHQAESGAEGGGRKNHMKETRRLLREGVALGSEFKESGKGGAGAFHKQLLGEWLEKEIYSQGGGSEEKTTTTKKSRTIIWKLDKSKIP